MKVAFIVGTFPVLSETFTLNQIVGALERGHEVDIYKALNHSDKKLLMTRLGLIGMPNV